MDLDFNKAIVAHSRWKTRITEIANGTSQEKLDPAIIAKDDVCDLGQWIAQAGQELKNVPQLAQLKAKHAEFHKITAEIAKKCGQANKAELLALLGTGSPFAKTSGEVIMLIREIEKLPKKA